MWPQSDKPLASSKALGSRYSCQAIPCVMYHYNNEEDLPILPCVLGIEYSSESCPFVVFMGTNDHYSFTSSASSHNCVRL